MILSHSLPERPQRTVFSDALGIQRTSSPDARAGAVPSHRETIDAVRDPSPECEYRYEEAKVKHVLYWCTIGGTSVASPLIASVFALAGGASKVEYPAKTLYENEVKSPGSLHDVTTGSNGECTKPFS
jgi:hypothetical protein